jgi:predicted nucleic acid-binding protein
LKVTVLVDTNVVARLIVNDDRDQVSRALEVLKTEGIEVSNTVLLECAWVLASRYRFPREQILVALQALERTEGVAFTTPEAANAAIGWFASGMDIADAIHLSQTSAGRAIATFDEGFAATAGSIGISSSVRLI